LTERPGLKGTIWCRFVIDEQGNVVSCRVDSSTVRDTTLEKRLAACITGWKFDRTGTPGDLLSVTYPFVFSPGGESSNGAFIATVTAVLSLCALAAVLFL
jgi:TonB family protein